MVEQSDKGCFVPGAPLAVGYWGRDIHAHVFNSQQMAKERALLEAQIQLGGIKAALWLGVEDGPKCGCYKETNRQADRKCSACHGTGLVPGYRKFGYDTLHMNGADTGVTLTDVRMTKSFKSSKVELVDGALTGVIESGDKPFTRDAVGSTWEVDSQYFLREEGVTSVVVQYSLNGGAGWSDISDLSVQNPTSGMIRFRAILSRDEADALTPYFEIVRARYSHVGLSKEDPATGDYRVGPWILVMREPPKTGYRKQEYGDLPIEENMELWTAGMSVFDPTITVGSPQEMVKGPKVAMEILQGARAGTRYVTTNWKNSDPMAYIIVNQTFTIRIADPVEPMSLLW